MMPSGWITLAEIFFHPLLCSLLELDKEVRPYVLAMIAPECAAVAPRLANKLTNALECQTPKDAEVAERYWRAICAGDTAAAGPLIAWLKCETHTIALVHEAARAANELTKLIRAATEPSLRAEHQSPKGVQP